MNSRIKITIILFSVFSFIWSQNCCEAEAEANENCGGLGCYIPQCTEDCNWETMQCWSSTGYCWCVDENGVEIEGSSMPSWQGTPDCEEHMEAGDVNGDGDINVLDVVAIIGFIIGTNTPSDSEFLAGGFPSNYGGRLSSVLNITVLLVSSIWNQVFFFLEPDFLYLFFFFFL